MSATLDEAIGFYVKAVARAITAAPEQARYVIRLGSRWVDALESIQMTLTLAKGPLATTFSERERDSIAYVERVMTDPRISNDALIGWLDAYPAGIEAMIEARTTSDEPRSSSFTHADGEQSITSWWALSRKRIADETQT